MFKKTRLRFSDKEYTIGGVLSSALAVISFIVFGYSVALSFRARGEGSQQVVDGCCGNVGVGVASCNYACELVNPPEQVATEQSAVMVHVSRADEILLLGS